ncbi:MAG: discoidin domain-containing protein [Clostridia bacterium]|nr:discoidin domain-containing protein [Clostridia bacterium]
MKKIITLLLVIAMMLSLLFVLPALGADALIATGSDWKIETSSHISSWGNVNNAFDGDVSTHWHTFYRAEGAEIVEKDEAPHTVTVTFPKEMEISGWRYTPRQDNSAGTITAYNIYGSKDGKNFEKIYRGTFGYKGGNAPRPVESAYWEKISVRAIRIETTESVAGYGSAAEIQFYGGGAAGTATQTTEKNTVTEKTTSDIKVASLAPAENLRLSATFSGKEAQNAVDGKEDTYFTTGKNNALVEVTLAEKALIAGFSYTPREDSGEGIWTSYTVYGSADGENFVKLGAGTFDYGHLYANRTKKVGSFGFQAWVTKLRFTITTPDHFISAAEIGLLVQNENKTVSDNSATNSGTTSADVTESQADGEALSYDASWKIETSSHISSWGNVKHAFDGDIKTHWHTFYRAEGTEIVEKDEAPHTVTVTFPKEMEISGWRYTPRQDNSAGTITAYNIYGSKDGKNFEKIYSGTFGYDGGNNPRPIESAYWGKTSVRAIRIETTESIAGYGSAAEIEFLTGGSANASAGNAGTGTDSAVTADGFLNYNSLWKIETSSHISSWGNVKHAFDGDLSTHWHTYYRAEGTEIVEKDEAPHTVTVTFPKEMEISGWRYTPRQDNLAGTITAYNIYGSKDGKKFEKIYSDTFGYEGGSAPLPVESAHWEKVAVRAVRVEVTQAIAGYGSAAEIQFKGGEITNEDNAGYASDGTPKLSRKNWKIDASSKTSWGGPELMLDGNTSSYWHTFYSANGATIIEQDTVPHTIDLTLPSLTTISGFSFLPRAENGTGRLLNYELYVSDSLDGEFVKLAEYVDKDTAQEKEHIFTANIDVRRVRFIVTHAKGGYGVAAELYLFAENPEKDKISYAEFEAHDAEHKLYEIDNSLFTAEQNGEIWSFFDTVYLFDGAEDIPARWFQTEIGKDFVLVVDMKDTYTLKEIEYVPRQSEDLHGHWTLLNVSYSPDGVTWVDAIKNLEMNASLETKKIVFEEEITARYIEFDIMKSVTNRISGHELKFYQTKAARDGVTANKEEKYVLTVGKNELEVTKNGSKKTITLDAAPYIVNGTTLIPLRGLLEEMGKSVSWDGDNQTIKVDNGSITLQIHNRLVYVEDDVYGKVRYTLLTVPVITDNRTFIPVRFVSEQLGYSVSWDGETGEIVITK